MNVQLPVYDKKKHIHINAIGIRRLFILHFETKPKKLIVEISYSGLDHFFVFITSELRYDAISMQASLHKITPREDSYFLKTYTIRLTIIRKDI